MIENPRTVGRSIDRSIGRGGRGGGWEHATIQDRDARLGCRTASQRLASRNKKRSTTAAVTPTWSTTTMIDRCSCRAVSAAGASHRRSWRSVRGSARVTRREETGNWTKRSRVARATRAPSAPRARGSTVPQTSQRDYSLPPWSRCAGCALAALSSGGGHLPPRSFLRDKPSSRCGWSRTRRCADTRRPGASAGCRSCPSPRGTRTRPGTGTTSPSGSAAVYASSPSASGASAAAGPAPAPRTSPPPGAIISARALACCNVPPRINNATREKSLLPTLPVHVLPLLEVLVLRVRIRQIIVLVLSTFPAAQVAGHEPDQQSGQRASYHGHH